MIYNRKIADKKYYDLNRERILKRNAEPKNRKKRTAYMRQWRRNNKTKFTTLKEIFPEVFEEEIEND